MSKLNYRTRGQSTSQSKPKVWFCGHPADFEPYFNDVADELLQKQNCAVWYDEEPTTPYQEEKFFSDLAEMDLFVVPVTTKLLTTENRAMDAELRFAVEKRKPILPLMCESGLEALFEAKCGDLLYLDRTDAMREFSSYGKRLGEILESVLVGDTLAERVREAFDAYIFLSCRKKDKEQVRELMRRIHKNEFCRDIAIWCDEFLAEGETFNQSIIQAIEKSAVVALAVTPNLLEEANQIMSMEYPKAKNDGKHILPAELVPTDRERLLECYEELPECVDAYDDEALQSALLEALSNVEIHENDDDPEHNYLIGLAYLSGIDVERDAERAIGMIEGAAEAELPEAMEKMASVYRMGDGIERDHEKALAWQKRLVDYRKALYDSFGSETDTHLYIRDLCRLAENTAALKRYEEARSLYAELVSLCHTAEKTVSENWVKRYRAVAHDALGDIRRESGKLAEADKEYRNLLDLGTALLSEAKQEDFYALSVTYEKLGDVSVALDLPKEAVKHYTKAKMLRESLAEQRCVPDVRTALSASHRKLGFAYRAMGRLADAKQCCQCAVGLDTALALETDAAEAFRGLSISYEALGDVENAMGRLAEALGLYAKSLAIREELEKETGTIASRRDLTASYEKLCDAHRALGDMPKATAVCEKAMELAKTLDRQVGETGTTWTKRTRSACLTRMGEICMAQGAFEEAQKHLEAKLALDEELCKETDAIGDFCALGICYDRLGAIAEEYDKPKEAENILRRMLSLNRSLSLKTGLPEARRELALCYGRMAKLSLASENLEDTEKYCAKRLTLSEELVRETGTVIARRDLAAAYTARAERKRSLGDAEDALLYAQKALTVRGALARESEEAEILSDLSASYLLVGDINVFRGCAEDALSYYKKAVVLSEDLVIRTDVPGIVYRLSVAYERLGDTLRLLGKEDEASEAYHKSTALRERFSQKKETVEAYRAMAEMYEHRSALWTSLDEYATADLHCGKAMKIREMLAQKKNTPRVNRELAACYERMGDIHYAYGRKFGREGDANRARNEINEAEAHYRTAMDLRETLVKETKTPKAKRELAVAYAKLASFHKRLKRLDAAAAYYRNALALREELANQTYTDEAQRELVDACYQLLDVRMAKGAYIDAEALGHKAYAIASSLAEGTRDRKAREGLAFGAQRLGDVYARMGKAPNAGRYYLQAAELCESMAKEDATPEVCNDLATSYYKLAGVTRWKPKTKERYLTKALDLWSQLAEQCPDFPHYAKMRDMAKDALKR